MFVSAPVEFPRRRRKEFTGKEYVRIIDVPLARHRLVEEEFRQLHRLVQYLCIRELLSDIAYEFLEVLGKACFVPPCGNCTLRDAR